MKDKNTNGKELPGRRFREAVDGPEIREKYSKMPTKELARQQEVQRPVCRRCVMAAR